jgi:hypothetical protein
MKYRLAIVVATLGLALSPALATPSGLLNKTIKVSWFQQTPGLEIGTSNSGSAGRSVSIILYVSSAGRIFSKFAQRTGRFTADNAVAPEGSLFRSEGSQLVGLLHPRAGAGNSATRVTVSFDGGFQSCTAEVILGSEGGKPLEWTGLNGLKYRATGHPTISQQSCAISNGNPFAN